jgi:hypothetical protein
MLGNIKSSLIRLPHFGRLSVLYRQCHHFTPDTPSTISAVSTNDIFPMLENIQGELVRANKKIHEQEILIQNLSRKLDIKINDATNRITCDVVGTNIITTSIIIASCY